MYAAGAEGEALNFNHAAQLGIRSLLGFHTVSTKTPPLTRQRLALLVNFGLTSAMQGVGERTNKCPRANESFDECRNGKGEKCYV